MWDHRAPNCQSLAQPTALKELLYLTLLFILLLSFSFCNTIPSSVSSCLLTIPSLSHYFLNQIILFLKCSNSPNFHLWVSSFLNWHAPCVHARLLPLLQLPRETGKVSSSVKYCREPHQGWEITKEFGQRSYLWPNFSLKTVVS